MTIKPGQLLETVVGSKTGGETARFRYNPGRYPASCLRCYAYIGEPCRTHSGKTTHPHAGRDVIRGEDGAIPWSESPFGAVERDYDKP